MQRSDSLPHDFIFTAMAYLARDGRLYSHKETPRQYSERTGTPLRRSTSNTPLARTASSTFSDEESKVALWSFFGTLAVGATLGLVSALYQELR